MSAGPSARRRSCLKNVVENTGDPETEADKDEDKVDSTAISRKCVSFTNINEIKEFTKDSIETTCSSIEESSMNTTHEYPSPSTEQQVENLCPPSKLYDVTFLVEADRNADLSMTIPMKEMDDDVTHNEGPSPATEVENVCPSQKAQDATFLVRTADMSITTIEEPRFTISFNKSSICEKIFQTTDLSMTTTEEPRITTPFNKSSECDQVVQPADISITTIEEPRTTIPFSEVSKSLESEHRTADTSMTITLEQSQDEMLHFFTSSSMQNSVNDTGMSLTMDVESRRVRSLLKTEPVTTPYKVGSKVLNFSKIKNVHPSPCSSSTSSEAKSNDQRKMFTVKVMGNETSNPAVPVQFVNIMKNSQDISAFGKFGLLKTPKRQLPVDIFSTPAGKVSRQESKGDIVSINIQSNKQPVEVQSVKPSAVPAEVTLPIMAKPSAVPAEVTVPTEVNACAVPTSSLHPSSTSSCIPLGDRIAALKVLRGLDRVEALKEFARKLQPLSDAEFDIVINTITGFVHPSFIQAQLKLREYEKIMSCTVFPTNPDDPALIFSRRIMRQIHAEEAK